MVRSLYIYPVKSLGGIRLETMELKSSGPLYDRSFMLIDERGRFLSQREFPAMALFSTQIKGDILIVRHDHESLHINLNSPRGENIKAQVWRQEVISRSTDKKADEWFSRLLNTSCRLVTCSPDFPRIKSMPKSPWKSPLSFADGYPYLIVGSKSLEDLNDRLETPVAMARFRPNIVIETSIPYIEDEWDEISIGDVVFKVIKSCARCVMTTIDQNSGIRGTEPLSTLSKYRKINNEILFGVNAVLIKGNQISAEDKIHVNR